MEIHSDAAATRLNDPVDRERKPAEKSRYSFLTVRYRYYVSDGHSTVHFAPRDAGAGGRAIQMDGMDAVIDVLPPDVEEPGPAAGISRMFDQHQCPV